MHKSWLLIAGILIGTTLFSQNDQVLFSVDGEPVYLSEFKYIYEKSNNKNPDYSAKSLQESMDLYTRFKLKVTKARELKMDTIPSLKAELANYKNQLADTYLSDKEIGGKLAEELWQRSQNDVRFSHLFIACGPEMSRSDTVAPFAKVKEVEVALKSGKNFETLVKQFSEDASSVQTGGDMGFMAPMFPEGFYTLENAVYTTPKGKVSPKTRTVAGWHFVKVTDIKPARGEVEIAQILIRTSKEVNDDMARGRITAIAEELKNNGDFTEIARKFSEDKTTSGKGGYLGFIKINQYDPAFEDAAFTLKNDGDISQPIKTELGYHLIQRISKKNMDDFEKSKKNLIARVAQNERYEIAKNILVEKIKRDNNFTTHQKVYKTYYDSVNTDNFYTAGWAPPIITSAPIFSFDNYTITTADLSDYLKQNARQRVRLNRAQVPGIAFEGMFNEFVAEQAMKYEESKLEDKYPDYKALTREYEEGFLFFEVTNDLIWSKASQDTAGIENYYTQNRKKYMWEERARIIHYTLNAKSPEELNKMYESIPKNTPEDMQKKFGMDNVAYTTEVIEKSSASNLHNMKWHAGSTSDLHRAHQGNSGTASKVESIIPAEPKELKDARGFVIADYQDFLDKQWVEQLKKEYSVQVNQDVYKSLIKN